MAGRLRTTNPFFDFYDYAFVPWGDDPYHVQARKLIKCRNKNIKTILPELTMDLEALRKSGNVLGSVRGVSM